jgi:hypothetical protein
MWNDKATCFVSSPRNGSVLYIPHSISFLQSWASVTLWQLPGITWGSFCVSQAEDTADPRLWTYRKSISKMQASTPGRHAKTFALQTPMGGG